MRVVVLGSGSRGNATLIEAGGARILVDAGIPIRTLRERLEAVTGDDRPAIDGIVVTHAHCDHGGHAGATARALRAPLYVTASTHRGLRGVDDARVRTFGAAARFTIGPLEVFPCPVPHDAPQVAIAVAHGGTRCAIVTDCGEPTLALQQHLRGCDAVLIESNHDLGLLMEGPYPESVKRRVAGPRGHLNNQQCGKVLSRLGRETTQVVLLHISETNNRPELVHHAATEALSRHRHVRLQLAKQDVPLEIQVAPRPRPMQQLPLFTSPS